MSLINDIKKIYTKIKENNLLKIQNQLMENIFQNYHNEIQRIINDHNSKHSNENEYVIKSQITSSSTDSISTQQPNSPVLIQQPSYIFLQNIWHGKYCQKQSQQYDSQDHIDKINKIVAMMRTNIQYMTRKQNYMYEKQQSNQQYLYQNPLFMKIKQELQRLRMWNQEIMQDNGKKSKQIQKLKNQKSLIQKNYQDLKKKYQNMQKNWIEISKKNILLEQELMTTVKIVNSKTKFNQIRQSTESKTKFNQIRQSTESKTKFNQIRQSTESKTKFNQIRQSTEMNNLSNNIELITSTSFKKLPDWDTQRNSHMRSQRKINQNQKTALRPLQSNVFNSINLKQTNQKKASNRYSKSSLQNQQVQNINNVIPPVNQNSHSQIPQILIAQQRQPLNFKYIKYQGSNRKALMSSVRSLDLAQKTSIAKPKFQRTKLSTYQNLLKSVGKDQFISSEQNLQKPSTLKKKHFLTGESNMYNYRSPLRVKRSDMN